jgi:carboxylesterase type B
MMQKLLRLTTSQVAGCLRSVSTTTLQDTAPEGGLEIIYSNLNPIDFQPYVDSVTIPAQPWVVGPKVPMIFGSNADEGGLFALGTYMSPVISPENYTIFLNENFGTAASLVAQQYPLTLPAFNKSGFPAFTAISTIITQAQFTCPAYQAMLKAQANNISVYTYLNSHVPSCQWWPSLPAPAIPFVGATHTSEIPFVFGNGIGQPLSSPNGTCNFTAQENVLSESLVAAWTAMAETGNPSVSGGLQWPQWDNSSSKGVTIVNGTTVGTVDYSFCGFWDMIDRVYLNFTDLSAGANGTSGNGSTGTGSVTGNRSGAEGVEIGVWGLTLAVGIVISVLMG